MPKESERKAETTPHQETDAGLRLLGLCPTCREEDSIVRASKIWTPEYDKVVCESCQTTWPDWLNLRYEEEQKGNRLIPVLITRDFLGVRLSSPNLHEIPQRFLIVAVLNTALITKFNMRVDFACEGGIHGIHKRSYLELRNWEDLLGLFVEEGDSQQEGSTEVLNFYEKMLNLLFLENFKVGEREYHRGEILKLSPEKQTADDVWELLNLMLRKIGKRPFAQKVSEAFRRTIDSFAYPYIRGLTLREIKQSFVPPPITS